MKITVLQVYLPVFILFGSLLFVRSIPKIFIFTLPALSLALLGWSHMMDWTGVQIALWVIWALHTWGNWRMAAFAKDGIESGPAMNVMIALSVLGGGLLVYLSGTKDLWEIVVLTAFFGVCVYFLLDLIAQRVITPLFVKTRIPHQALLADYYKVVDVEWGWGKWSSCIRFEGDPTRYDTGFFGFNRYRNKVGVPYSYIKCECIFGFSYITRIKPLSDAPGKPSA